MAEGLINRLRHWFAADAPAPLPEADANLALGALLVRMAKADGNYAATEIAQIDKALAASFDLGPIEAAKMRATCERLESHAPDAETFAALIRAGTSREARARLLGALWQVAMADGVLEAAEEATLNDIRDRLGLTAEEAADLRAEAENPGPGA